MPGTRGNQAPGAVPAVMPARGRGLTRIGFPTPRVHEEATVTHRDRTATVPRFVIPILLVTAALTAYPVLARSAPGHSHMPMTEAAMKALADDYWASHTPVGEPSKLAATIVITGRNF